MQGVRRVAIDGEGRAVFNRLKVRHRSADRFPRASYLCGVCVGVAISVHEAELFCVADHGAVGPPLQQLIRARVHP